MTVHVERCFFGREKWQLSGCVRVSCLSVWGAAKEGSTLQEGRPGEPGWGRCDGGAGQVWVNL